MLVLPHQFTIKVWRVGKLIGDEFNATSRNKYYYFVFKNISD
jgi:hypothetical protein